MTHRDWDSEPEPEITFGLLVFITITIIFLSVLV